MIDKVSYLEFFYVIIDKIEYLEYGSVQIKDVDSRKDPEKPSQGKDKVYRHGRIIIAKRYRIKKSIGYDYLY